MKCAAAVLAVCLLGLAAENVTAGPKERRGPKGPTIVDVAIAINTNSPYAGEFDTLIAALLAADPAVLDALDGNGQYTVFAPTDGAFAILELTEDNIDTLPQAYLTDVLLCHVARGRRYADSVLDATRIRMLEGGFVLQDEGFLTDNLNRDSEIIVTDVEAANGVIHAIGGVLLPYAPPSP